MRRTGWRSLLRVPLLVSLAFGSSLAEDSPVNAPDRGDTNETVGVPWTGAPGVTETVAEIMEGEARTPAVKPRGITEIAKELAHFIAPRVSAGTGLPDKSSPR